jgi:hypothetical protein
MRQTRRFAKQFFKKSFANFKANAAADLKSKYREAGKRCKPQTGVEVKRIDRL